MAILSISKGEKNGGAVRLGGENAHSPRLFSYKYVCQRTGRAEGTLVQIVAGGSSTVYGSQNEARYRYTSDNQM
jgi:hypothetical protein